VSKRGFTLVELMVIVAIIGLFSMIALTSLSGSRHKGNDAAIKQQLREIQNAVELYGLYNGNVFGVANTCTEGMFDGGKIKPLLTALASANLDAEIQCRSTNRAYAVQTQLVSDLNKYWCVDSTGYQGVSDVVNLPNLPTTPRCPGH
jgi:prepilin-type N-terminal cleavage/methylation domain-containing protein